jgi:hypothetical protein
MSREKFNKEELAKSLLKLAEELSPDILDQPDVNGVTMREALESDNELAFGNIQAYFIGYIEGCVQAGMIKEEDLSKYLKRVGVPSEMVSGRYKNNLN